MWIGKWEEVMGSRKRLFVRHLPSVLRIMSGDRLHTVNASSSQLDFTYNFGNKTSHDPVVVTPRHLRYHPLQRVPNCS